MFAARSVPEEGCWRLCIRRGRVIEGSLWPDGVWVEWKFKDQKHCQAASDELNEKVFPAYDKFVDKEGKFDKQYQDDAKELAVVANEIVNKYRMKLMTEPTSTFEF